jgi:hypothetical protein
MLQRNAGSVRLKNVQEGSERICAKIPVLHVICEGKDSRHPSNPCKMLLKAHNANKSTQFLICAVQNIM